MVSGDHPISLKVGRILQPPEEGSLQVSPSDCGQIISPLRLLIFVSETESTPLACLRDGLGKQSHWQKHRLLSSQLPLLGF